MAVPKKVRIGDLLVKENLLTESQLEEVLEKQKELGGKLGSLIIELGYVKETDFLQALARQLTMPFIELEHYDIKPEIITKLPEKLARRYRVIVLDFIDDNYLIGMADPTDVIAYDEVNQFLKAPIRASIVREADLLRLLDLVYRRTEDIASFAEELKHELQQEDTVIGDEALGDVSDDQAPVAKLLESIFQDAVQVGASDIHIEPDESKLRIRMRVDGLLQESIVPGKEVAPALVLRIKLLAKLNISEKRLPQDGRFNMRVKKRSIDVRVSTMPIQHGESVVMRLLDQTQGILKLEQIGMEKHVMERTRFHINRPSGLVLVTGPTGSGKTTTLYAALCELNNEEKKIITIEDPVEYRVPRINQVQIRTNIDLTFARVLRSSLRQDPDIVMVGEMRDEETARIGLRAAMTGHLVLSTLHTNDAISSAIRLIDMGAEGFLVAGSLRCVLAQRLVRRLCESCQVEDELDKEHQEWLHILVGEIDPNWQFFKGSGCSNCNHSGYSGRIGVHEFLEITPQLADALRQEDSVEFTRLALKQRHFKPLPVCALEHAMHKRTSVDEVFRIAGEIEDVRRRGSSESGFLDISSITI